MTRGQMKKNDSSPYWSLSNSVGNTQLQWLLDSGCLDFQCHAAPPIERREPLRGSSGIAGAQRPLHGPALSLRTVTIILHNLGFEFRRLEKTVACADRWRGLDVHIV